MTSTPQGSVRFRILGSCVTRDAFEFAGPGGPAIETYFARSSIASAFSELPFEGVDTSTIESSFQRRIVEWDLQKRCAATLASADFDVLVIDLIDERFDLIRDTTGALATRSNEFLKAHDIDPSAERITAGSAAYIDLWVAGWRRLLSIVDQAGLRDAIVVHEAYWAERTQAGASFSSAPPELVAQANEFLGRLYSEMRRDLAAAQFLRPTSRPLVGADEHKWGRSPFHYPDWYYDELMTLIEGFPGRRAARPAALALVEERSLLPDRVPPSVGLPEITPHESVGPGARASAADSPEASLSATPFVAMPPPYLDFAVVAVGSGAGESPTVRTASSRLIANGLDVRLVPHSAGDVLVVSPGGRRYGDDQGLVYGLSGLAMCGGRLLVPSEQPTAADFRGIDPACGHFSAFEVRDGEALVTTDAFGYGFSFLSEHEGVAISSNRLHLHAMVMRAFSLRVAPDPVSVASALFTDHGFFAQQNALSRTMVDGVAKVAVDQNAIVGGVRPRGRTVPKGALQSALARAEGRYEAAVAAGADRVAANVRAALEAAEFESIILELSAGKDTRLVLGAAMQTAGWRERVKVKTRGTPHDPDVEISSGIASLFDLRFFEGSTADLFPASFQDNVNFWRSYYFGEYHRFAAGGWTTLGANRSELAVGGANGEIYREFWSSVQRRDLMQVQSTGEFAQRFVRRVAVPGGFAEEALDAVASDLGKELRAGHGPTLEALLEDHYLRHRNRSHCGLRGFTFMHEQLTWYPLMAPELFAAARTIPWEKRAANQVIHDVLVSFHPLLAEIPFHGGDPFERVDRSRLSTALQPRLNVTLDRSVDAWSAALQREKEGTRARHGKRVPVLRWSEFPALMAEAFGSALEVVLDRRALTESVADNLRDRFATLMEKQPQAAYQLASRVMAVADALQ